MLNSKYRLNQQHPEIRQGTLLVSTPVNCLSDRTKLLVLVIRHNEFSGTTGLILNKIIDSELIFNDSGINNKSFDFHYGGPVESHSVSFMVSFPNMRNGLQDSVYWINDFHDLVILLNMVNSEDITIQAFRGCMKWEAGQLCKEISHKMWWTNNRFSLDDLTMKNNHRWEYYARKNGGYFSPLVDAEIPIIYN